MIPGERLQAGQRGGSAAAAPNSPHVAREPIGIEQFEYRLLRRSVGVLRGDRSSCAGCGRTPLTGEMVYVYEGHGAELLCELCRARSDLAPSAGFAVRHAEQGHAVRRLPRAA